MFNSVCEVLIGAVYLFMPVPLPGFILLFMAERKEDKQRYISERKKRIYQSTREYQSRLYRKSFGMTKRYTS